MPSARLPLGLLRCWPGLVLCLAALGCSGVTVRRADSTGLFSAVHASAVTEGGDLSPRSLQTLHRHDLERLYHREPAEAFATLRRVAVQDHDPEILFTLAEMSYLLGREAEKWESPHACVFYFLCAGYAYHYLFDGQDGKAVDGAVPVVPGPPDPAATAVASLSMSPYDPRFRLACDLYNTGLAKCIRAAQRIGRLDPRTQLQLPTPDGEGFTLSVGHRGFAWKPEEFGPLLFCCDFEVEGLNNQYHGYGLGVPLIGTRADNAPAPAGAFYPRDVNFPVTAFFRFEGTVADLGTQRSGCLELYNPLTVQTVDLGKRTVPLETDLTTPLAYFLSRTDLRGIELPAFLHADGVRNRTGIYMFEPYQPGKVPVVMVHGLLASPVTWAALFNDLQADPFLREHFQFWFYLYPTGNPYLVTAADLRTTLAAVRSDVDPRHQDPALDDMVLVGHSMGGLVSRLLTVDSGPDFWRLVSAESFDSLKAQPQTRDELRQIFFFERQPCVRRVIFLATPHHGSQLSPSPIGRLAANLVGLPRQLRAATSDLVRENPNAGLRLAAGELPTSVDLLAPGAPALELLAARTRPPEVRYHSIIGKAPKGDLGAFFTVLATTNPDEGITDGVVSYASAHLDGVESEVLVPADHDHVHRHPLATREVRRILLEHWKSYQGAAGGIQRVSDTPDH